MIFCFRWVIDHVVIWSIRWNKTGFFPSCGCVNTTVWMHHMDANKMHREKSRWELLSNARNYLEQILEGTSHKTTAVRPLTFHLKNHQNKKTNTCRTLLEMYGRSFVLPWTPTHGRASCCRLAKRIYISSVWTQDVVRKTCQIDDGDGSGERVQKIHAVCLTW